jgi:hypothetical protein
MIAVDRRGDNKSSPPQEVLASSTEERKHDNGAGKQKPDHYIGEIIRRQAARRFHRKRSGANTPNFVFERETVSRCPEQRIRPKPRLRTTLGIPEPNPNTSTHLNSFVADTRAAIAPGNACPHRSVSEY